MYDTECDPACILHIVNAVQMVVLSCCSDSVTVTVLREYVAVTKKCVTVFGAGAAVREPLQLPLPPLALASAGLFVVAVCDDGVYAFDRNSSRCDPFS